MWLFVFSVLYSVCVVLTAQCFDEHYKAFDRNVGVNNCDV
jgi:hypothetical protein